jgi:hypothetical protein
MSDDTLTETQFLNLVSIIVSQHGCHLEDVDLDKRIINIAGPSEAEYACAVELDAMLIRYTTEQRLPEPDAMDNYYLDLEAIVA